MISRSFLIPECQRRTERGLCTLNPSHSEVRELKRGVVSEQVRILCCPIFIVRNPVETIEKSWDSCVEPELWIDCFGCHFDPGTQSPTSGMAGPADGRGAYSNRRNCRRHHTQTSRPGFPHNIHCCLNKLGKNWRPPP